MTERLPALLDCRGVMDELGVKRAAAEAIMRAIPTITLPGLRKNYCRRDDVHALIKEHTNHAVTRKPRIAA